MKKLILIGLLLVVQSSLAQGFFGKGSQTMGDVFNSDCCWLGKYKISGSLGTYFSKITYKSNDNTKFIDYNRYGVNYNMNIAFYKDFQVRFSLFGDLNQDETKPKWLSNLYYSIGNFNWRNHTFSYGYENYQPNRFDGTFDFLDNMKRGFFFVSFNHYALGEYFTKAKLDETTQLYTSPFIRYQYEYTDRYGQKVLGNHKFVLGASTRYVIWNNFYIEGAVYFYPDKKSKMPWDPDFTYGFGYFNWRSFKFNFSYGNWIANRFPWNKKEMKNDFSNGEFKAVFSYIW